MTRVTVTSDCREILGHCRGSLAGQERLSGMEEPGDGLSAEQGCECRLIAALAVPQVSPLLILLVSEGPCHFLALALS